MPTILSEQDKHKKNNLGGRSRHVFGTGQSKQLQMEKHVTTQCRKTISLPESLFYRPFTYLADPQVLVSNYGVREQYFARSGSPD
jgi:hypothetical protein